LAGATCTGPILFSVARTIIVLVWYEIKLNRLVSISKARSAALQKPDGIMSGDSQIAQKISQDLVRILSWPVNEGRNVAFGMEPGAERLSASRPQARATLTIDVKQTRRGVSHGVTCDAINNAIQDNRTEAARQSNSYYRQRPGLSRPRLCRALTLISFESSRRLRAAPRRNGVWEKGA
jgi:hypothetical protein